MSRAPTLSPRNRRCPRRKNRSASWGIVCKKTDCPAAHSARARTPSMRHTSAGACFGMV